MELAIILGIAAFLLIASMVAILAVSSRNDVHDPITETVIVRATTDTLAVIPSPDARESTPKKESHNETSSADSE